MLKIVNKAERARSFRVQLMESDRYRLDPVQPVFAVGPGEVLPFRLALERAHLFDGETGQSLEEV